MKVIVSIAILLIIFFIGGVVYSITGLGKWFYHDILEWHRPNNKENFDGCSFHSICKHCGKEIMQDSQGNWF